MTGKSASSYFGLESTAIASALLTVSRSAGDSDELVGPVGGELDRCVPGRGFAEPRLKELLRNMLSILKDSLIPFTVSPKLPRTLDGGFPNPALFGARAVFASVAARLLNAQPTAAHHLPNFFIPFPGYQLRSNNFCLSSASSSFA